MKSKTSKKLICFIMALSIMVSTSFIVGLVGNAYTPQTPTSVSGLWYNGAIDAFSFYGQALNVDYSENYVIQAFGNPDRIDPSEYGFSWYIYKFNNTRYIQIGIQNSKVVAFYSNYSDFQYYSLSQQFGTLTTFIPIGTDKSTVRAYMGTPLYAIYKGNLAYTVVSDEKDVFLSNNKYFTIFYDIHNNNKVTSMQVVDKATEEAFNNSYGIPSAELSNAYELQIFDITNAIRARNGKAPYVWSAAAANVARAHSQDMAVRNFFAHQNPDGINVGGRLNNAGISWWLCAENIAAGQSNAIEAVESWMNSLGHRNSILGNCTNLGTGVYMGGLYGMYYTQNFYTPW